MQFNKDITGFTGGVSQQPAFLRSETQCEESLNAWPSLVYGNMKRPPLEHVAVLTSQAAAGAFMHSIRRDKNEKYNMLLTGDATEPLEVYTLGGTKCTIRYGHLDEDLVFSSDATVKSYLTPGEGVLPRETFKATTIADHTLIANTNKVCAMSGDPDTSVQANEGFVYVKKGVAKTSYEVYLNGTLAGSYLSGETTDYNSYNSKTIAQALLNSILAGTTVTVVGLNGIHTYLLSGPPAGTPLSVRVNGSLLDGEFWTVAQYDGQWKLVLDESVEVGADGGELGWVGYPISIAGGALPGYELFLQDAILRIRREDDADFTLRVADSYANEAMEGIYKKVQSFQKLPPRFFSDVVIEIVGDDTSAFDNYWVKFDGTSSTWTETRKPGMDNNYDKSTMPHRLVRTGTNEFTFADINWTERKVGDETSAEVSSFIGDKIREVYYYRNRLGFFAGENNILSKAGFFFTFWPTTATDSLDDDPIDVAGNAGEIVTINHAIPFEKTLLAVGDEVQLQFNTGNQSGLTPKTLNSDVTTRFNISPNCKPVLIGSNVYLAVADTQHTHVYEYFLQANAVSFDAANVTSHCPTYLPPNITRLTGSSTYDVLFALSEDTPNTIYVYKYYWDGDSKVQSAWGKWTFGVDILDISMVDEYLHVVTSGDGEVCLQKIDLAGTKTGTLPRVNLDRRVSLVGVYDALEGTTTWTLPYAVPEETPFAALKASQGYPLIRMKSVGNTLTTLGNHSSGAYLMGIEYTHQLDLSRFYLKDSNKQPYIFGTTLLRTLSLGYFQTGYLEVHVITPGRDADVYVLSPFTEGVPGNVIVLADGTFTDTLIMAESGSVKISVRNHSFLPSVVVNAAYEGSYYARAKKV